MYTQEERVKIVEFFIETRSITATQRRFCNYYGIKFGNKPDYKMVVDIVNRFQSTGSIHVTATRERDPPIRTPANIAQVCRSVENNPQTVAKMRATITSEP